MIKTVRTSHAPQPIGPYSQAVVANGFVFCSGQVGVDPATNTLAPAIEAQTKQTLENIQAVMQAAGTDLQHVVKTTIYLVDIADFAKVNALYEDFFKPHKPARSTVQIAKLPQGNFTHPPFVEIEAVAVIP